MPSKWCRPPNLRSLISNTGRNALNAEGLKNVVAVQLDVTDPATIAAAKETIEQSEGRLDVLVNNAG